LRDHGAGDRLFSAREAVERSGDLTIPKDEGPVAQSCYLPEPMGDVENRQSFKCDRAKSLV
jgi:hypothetical protein